MTKSRNGKYLLMRGKNTALTKEADAGIARLKRLQKQDNTLLEKRLISSFRTTSENTSQISYVDPDSNTQQSDLLELNENNDDVLGGFSENYNPKREDLVKKLKFSYKISSNGLAEKSTFFKIATFVVFLLAIWLSLANTAEYFIHHHHGWCGARRTLAARNYLRYGYLNLQMGPLDTRGYHVNKNGRPKFDKFYWHHPPLVSTTLSIVYGLFGESEANARLMSSILFWIIFIFLWLSFRNHWGDVPTFYALIIMIFMPFMATYNNFINFELMVTVWMAISLFTFDRYLTTKNWYYAALLFFAMFMGAYADYPMFVWMFYLWVVGVIRCFYIDRDLKKFLVYYVLAVGIILAIIVLQISLWKEAGNFSSLYGGRFKSNYTVFNTLYRTLRKWHYYYGFFGPVAYTFMAFYIIDLVNRVRKLNVTRGDGYLVALGLTGATYAIAVKDGTWVHTFFIWYFAVFVGLAGGYGLYRFLQYLKYMNIRKVHVVGFMIIIFAIIWALPIIQMKRANPIYTYTKPIYEMNSYLKFDYDLDKQVTAFIVREITTPGDFVLIDNSMPTDRNEFLTNMDREYKVTKNQAEFSKKIIKDKFKVFVVNIDKINTNFTLDLINTYKFIAYKSFFIFDLTGDILDNLQVRTQRFENASDLERYFVSLAHGKFFIEDNPLMALDYAIKFDRRESVNYYRKMFNGKYKAEAVDLESAVGIYNNNIDLGKKADIKEIFKWIDQPKEKYYFGSIELVGSRVYRRVDGKSEMILVLRTDKQIEQNFDLVFDGAAKHKDKQLRKMIGNRNIHSDTIIPMSIWKTGMLYTMRMALELESGGPYELKIHFDYKDSVVATNPENKDDSFQFKCKAWDKLPLKNMKSLNAEDRENYLREWVNNINNDPLSGSSLFDRARQDGLSKALKELPIGDDFTMLGCFSENTKHKNHYKTSILLVNNGFRSMGWEFNISGEGVEKDKKGKQQKKKLNETIKMRKETRELKPMELFWVEVNMPFEADGKKFQFRANTRKNTRLKIKDKNLKILSQKDILISKGDWGIRRPFAFLEKLMFDPLVK